MKILLEKLNYKLHFKVLSMSDKEIEIGHDDGLAVEEEKPKLKRPKKYKVVLINDDFTPMEFVIQVLQGYFKMDRETAVQVMMMVHTKGKGICGVFSKDIAETKVAQVNEYSRQNQHPLMCSMEED